MKTGLRQRLRAERREFVARMTAAGAIDAAGHAIADRVIAQLHGAQIVAGYWPAGSETDSRPALHA
ncbi:MAG: 5-formyltetrahydrofolate cyclo-ligase, partial [Sphingomonadaceae bacterium]